jgi:phosphatidylserine/phosphatidylglycerophosphate/cardiolipin synthase-like enzyme
VFRFGVRRIVVAVFGFVLLAQPAFAACNGAAVDVCFRPGRTSCAARIVAAISGAKETLLVQAYGFTNPEIIQAIGAAHRRGVAVRVVLDRTNAAKRDGKPRYSGATYLRNADVPVRIDDKVAIAHNKVMIVDGDLVIGGSYNYTRSAEQRNAENVTFTRSACVARLYHNNFERRWTASAPVG